MSQNFSAPRLRVLPLTILFLFLVLLLRVGVVFQEYYFFKVSKAYASDKKKKPDVPKKALPSEATSALPLPKETSEKKEKPEDQLIEEVLSFNGIEELEIIQDILKTKKSLETKKQELEAKENILNALKKQVTEQAQKIQYVQKEEKTKQKEVKESEKKIEEISKTFASMKGAEAAKILSQLNLDYATKILSKMSSAKQAPILASMPEKVAKQITERMIFL